MNKGISGDKGRQMGKGLLLNRSAPLMTLHNSDESSSQYLTRQTHTHTRSVKQTHTHTHVTYSHIYKEITQEHKPKEQNKICNLRYYVGRERASLAFLYYIKEEDIHDTKKGINIQIHALHSSKLHLNLLFAPMFDREFVSYAMLQRFVK